jgi:hypothetical protein
VISYHTGKVYYHIPTYIELKCTRSQNLNAYVTLNYLIQSRSLGGGEGVLNPMMVHKVYIRLGAQIIYKIQAEVLKRRKVNTCCDQKISG